MTFTEINKLQVQDCQALLESRLNVKRPDLLSIFQESDLADELILYKIELKKSRLSYELKLLVQNNCATIAAYPEAAGNYQAWLIDNIVLNATTDDAIEILQNIQAKEIQLAASSEIEAGIEAQKSLGRLARNTCQGIIDLISGYFITANLTTKQIDSLKSQFAVANAYLFGNQPWAAKEEIAKIIPEGDVVTSEIIKLINNEFSKSGLIGL